MQCNTGGYSFNTGVSSSLNFAIWFTQQTAWIWANTTNYSAASVPGYTDLAALFDDVMIHKIDITIFSGNDPTTSGSGCAQIAFCTDYNDKNAPANSGDVLQYADAKPFNMANNFINKMTLYPKFLTYSLDSAGTSTASTPKRGYLRSNLDTDHYGIKGAFINIPPNAMYHTYYFKYTYFCRVTK